MANINVSPVVGGQVQNNSGYGVFDLNNKVTGIRGSLLASFVTGASGAARVIGYLTDNLTNPTRRIVITLDGMNRPGLVLKDYFGADKAVVTPSYTGIPSGAQVVVLVSWDSTAVIDATRSAIFQVNRTSVPSNNWSTDPATPWTSFRPAYLVLGRGVGSGVDFNGQLLSFQISNDVVASGTSSGGTFPTSHVFDLFLNDTISATTT